MKSLLRTVTVVVLTVVFLTGIIQPVYADGVVYKKGDKNEIIAESQKSLKLLGFFNEECTGFFGEVTEKAVKAFQKKYSLGADGILGPTTVGWLKKLTPNSQLASRKQAQRDISKADVRYTVKKGDTIWDIASDYNVTVQVILEANKLDESTVLKIGQELIIPGVVTYIKPKSTVGAANKAAKPSEDNAEVYIVKKGDTLWTIAEDFGVPLASILELNSLTEASILQIDQEIKIPGTDNSTADSSTGSETSTVKKEPEKTLPEKAAPGKGEYLDWFGVVDKMFKNGDIVTVKDVDTGKTFKARRLYGRNHSDVEPLTSEDTAILKSIYGEWSWDRRAIIVTLDGHDIAASMNGMPHGEEAIKDNDFDGQFCIHFKGSKTHKGNKVDPGHQAAVRKAAGLE